MMLAGLTMMECEKSPGLWSEGAHPPAEAGLPGAISWGDMRETRPSLPLQVVLSAWVWGPGCLQGLPV